MTSDKELPGDEALSQLYRALPKDMPSQALDENILTEARRHTRRKPAWNWVWTWSLSLTAVAALALLYFGRPEEAVAPKQEKVAVLAVPPAPDVAAPQPKAEVASRESVKAPLPTPRKSLDDALGGVQGIPLGDFRGIGKRELSKKPKAERKKASRQAAAPPVQEQAREEVAMADESPVDEEAHESPTAKVPLFSAFAIPTLRPLSCADFAALKVACHPLPVDSEGNVLQFKAQSAEDEVLAQVVAELKRKGFTPTPGRLLEFTHALQRTVRLKKVGDAVWLVSP